MTHFKLKNKRNSLKIKTEQNYRLFAKIVFHLGKGSYRKGWFLCDIKYQIVLTFTLLLILKQTKTNFKLKKTVKNTMLSLN